MSEEKRRILVAVDGSEQSLEAVGYVGGALPVDTVQTVLFHVMSKIPEEYWDLEKDPRFRPKIIAVRAWEKQQEKMLEEFMEKARQVLIAAGLPDDAVSVNIHERAVGIARDIIHESQQGYHAVVVGRTGLSQLKDLILGSVAEKLISKLTEVPVWVVGKQPRSGKIMLAVDSSDGAMRAADYVGSMCALGDSEVRLIHVIRGFTIDPEVRSRLFATEEDKQWLAKVEEEIQLAGVESENIFAEARKRLVAAGLNPSRISTRLITGVSSRAVAIVEEARKEGFGTIVVGRRGLSAVVEFFMGRVSNKIIRLARDLAVWVVN